MFLILQIFQSQKRFFFREGRHDRRNLTAPRETWNVENKSKRKKLESKTKAKKNTEETKFAIFRTCYSNRVGLGVSNSVDHFLNNADLENKGIEVAHQHFAAITTVYAHWQFACLPEWNTKSPLQKCPSCIKISANSCIHSSIERSYFLFWNSVFIGGTAGRIWTILFSRSFLGSISEYSQKRSISLKPSNISVCKNNPDLIIIVEFSFNADLCENSTNQSISPLEEKGLDMYYQLSCILASIFYHLMTNVIILERK